MASDESLALTMRVMDRIRRERQVQGLTLRELSAMSGVDAGMISRAERNERWPSLSVLLDLSRALQLDFPEVIREAENTD
jgi:XRE family transcriptional regulator, regulator of sulfur utilization